MHFWYDKCVAFFFHAFHCNDTWICSTCHNFGFPKEVYENPDNVFVGGFFGSPAMNFFEGKLVDGYIHIGQVSMKVPQDKLTLLGSQGYNGKNLILGLRPEHIYGDVDTLAHFPDSTIEAKVEVSELTGAELMLYSSLEGQSYVARIHADATAEPGKVIPLSFDLAKAHFFDKETENRIR
jgi:multiple sugar transport system ATP-binding protein